MFQHVRLTWRGTVPGDDLPIWELLSSGACATCTRCAKAVWTIHALASVDCPGPRPRPSISTRPIVCMRAGTRRAYARSTPRAATTRTMSSWAFSGTSAGPGQAPGGLSSRLAAKSSTTSQPPGFSAGRSVEPDAHPGPPALAELRQSVPRTGRSEAHRRLAGRSPVACLQLTLRDLDKALSAARCIAGAVARQASSGAVVPFPLRPPHR
jgi:hypothetical protein